MKWVDQALDLGRSPDAKSQDSYIYYATHQLVSEWTNGGFILPSLLASLETAGWTLMSLCPTHQGLANVLKALLSVC